MNKTTRNWLIIASVLTVLGIVIFAVSMAALGFDFSRLDTLEHTTNTYEVSGSFDRITIDEDTADIVFASSGSDKCKVVCYEAEKMKHTVNCSDGTLSIGITDNRKWYDHMNISFVSPKMTVYLPENDYDSLLLNCCTGNIDIPGNFTFNKIDIETDTGDLTCKAAVSESISVVSDTGDADISSALSGCRINIQTDTGKIKLADISCSDLSAESQTGSISLTDTIASGSVRLKTDTGDIRLFHSDGGEFSVSTDTGDVEGSLLSGKIFSADSDTGEVDVPNTNTGGKCVITTDTGDISITVE